MILQISKIYSTRYKIIYPCEGHTAGIAMPIITGNSPTVTEYQISQPT